MAQTRRRLIVEGYVQGVFFRAATQEMAGRLQLSGWVRNRWDGTVEILVEGEESRVAELTRWCRHGPPGARVTQVQEKDEPYLGDFDGFAVRYG
jgi:acylphosphatase